MFATLHLWLTALTQVVTGLQWLALVFKKPSLAASSFTISSKAIAAVHEDTGEAAGRVRFE